jgi:hypothetical protein
VKPSRRWRTGDGSGCPRVRARVIPTSRVQVHAGVRVAAAPDDHFTPGPNRRVISSGSGRVGGAGSRPTINAGIVSAAGVQRDAVISTPDDHFAVGPHCRVIISRIGRVSSACSRPTVSAGVVSAAGV